MFQCFDCISTGFTALHLAIVKSRNEVAKLLISELGAKGVGSVSDTGITAAHVAASSGIYRHKRNTTLV